MLARLAPLLPRSFWRYAIVGIVSNLTFYGLFVVLFRLGASPPAAAGLCYCGGLGVSYLVNRRWSFDSRARHGSDLPRFLLAYGIGFVATMVFIAGLSRMVRPELAQIGNIVLTALVIYGALRLLGFGSAAGQEGAARANRTQ